MKTNVTFCNKSGIFETIPKKKKIRIHKRFLDFFDYSFNDKYNFIPYDKVYEFSLKSIITKKKFENEEEKKKYYIIMYMRNIRKFLNNRNIHIDIENQKREGYTVFF